jgi:serine/threonine protein kinase
MPLSIGDKLGPYEILAPIGKGGMGEVYRGRDSRLGRDVALVKGGVKGCHCGGGKGDHIHPSLARFPWVWGRLEWSPAAPVRATRLGRSGSRLQTHPRRRPPGEAY